MSVVFVTPFSIWKMKKRETEERKACLKQLHTKRNKMESDRQKALEYFGTLDNYTCPISNKDLPSEFQNCGAAINCQLNDIIYNHYMCSQKFAIYSSAKVVFTVSWSEMFNLTFFESLILENRLLEPI